MVVHGRSHILSISLTKVKGDVDTGRSRTRFGNVGSGFDPFAYGLYDKRSKHGKRFVSDTHGTHILTEKLVRGGVAPW